MKNNSHIVRVVVMAVVMINSLFLMNGISLLPFTNEEISMAISSVALVISEVWNHYKNNSYTDEAKFADDFIRELKKQKKIK